MSQIFISYANEDRPTAQIVAHALEAQGWAVWWDRKIPPGRSFDEVIGEALDGAKCVIVLWSKTSIQSEWVKEEAAEGASRKILVPALIDDVTIPLGFRRVHAARLVGWQGSSDHPEFHEFRESVARLLGASVSAAREPSRARTERQPTRPGPSPARTAWRWVASIAILLVGAVTGWGAGGLAYNTTDSDLGAFSAAIPIWLLGLVLAVVVWRRLR